MKVIFEIELGDEVPVAVAGEEDTTRVGLTHEEFLKLVDDHNVAAELVQTTFTLEPVWSKPAIEVLLGREL